MLVTLHCIHKFRTWVKVTGVSMVVVSQSGLGSWAVAMAARASTASTGALILCGSRRAV